MVAKRPFWCISGLSHPTRSRAKYWKAEWTRSPSVVYYRQWQNSKKVADNRIWPLGTLSVNCRPQQGQTEILSRLAAGQPAQANGVYNPTNHPGRNRQLVDPRGVGKPGILTGTIAENPSQFKTWRIKFANWILAVFPESHAIMRGLEEQTTVEITADTFLN